MQPATPEHLPKILSPKLRLMLGFLLCIIPLLAIAGAIAIPFYFESSSILYKFGFGRQLLRSGQVMRMVAGFETRFSIDRLEYQVGPGNYFEMGVIGRNVDILIALEVLK